MTMKAVICFLTLGFCYIIQISFARTWPPPPSWEKKATMARYLVHYADWGVVSAISPDYGYMPFGTIQSYCDGTLGNSTGIPYFYISELSDTYKNIKYNNSVTLALTQAESDYCESQEMDPEEPTCARLAFLGKMVAVTDAEEMTFARNALFTRHPAMKDWPSGHGWSFFKMVLNEVYLLDYYGGASHITAKDYFAAKPQ